MDEYISDDDNVGCYVCGNQITIEEYKDRTCPFCADGATSKFVKNDEGKRRWELIPVDALEEIIKVLEHGAVKYDDHNWSRGAAWSRYWSATMRHVTAWWWGESNDEETGLSHLAHAGCCIIFLLAYELRDLGDDDRLPPHTP